MEGLAYGGRRPLTHLSLNGDLSLYGLRFSTLGDPQSTFLP
jgi:hypothetical protein